MRGLKRGEKVGQNIGLGAAPDFARWYASPMKLLGGKWSRGDLLALLGVIAAVLAIPGMPKFFHWDSDSSATHIETPGTTKEPRLAIPEPKPVQKSRDASSGQVNFGCDQTLPVQTPVISFGKNPRDIKPLPAWANTDNVKAQNQSVVNVEDPGDHRVTGIRAIGTITGQDSQNVLGVKNCPGGGHGELTLHVSWTEDE
jgi:hypothetical protein